MDKNLPKCIGIILDGNRRWAKAKGLPALEGHRVGLQETLRKAILFVRDRGIKNLAVYMFSTENWNRDPSEVSYLMDLFREQTKKEVDEWNREGVRVRFVGQRGRFSQDLQDAMKKVEQDTANNENINLWICMSYGGRAEIIEAAKSISVSGEEVTEETFSKHMWSSGMPDPDIIIRTGGEKRLSGFLTWQSVYSELFFVKECWPDFNEKILDSILDEYSTRERRMGK